jgi:hypothetical protein
MAKKKVTLNEKDSEELLPIVREFNKLADAMIGLFGHRVKSKERKISVMVSRIKRPDQKSQGIDVQSVTFDKSFLKEQRGKKKKSGSSSSNWNDDFTQQKGFVI